MPTFQSLKNALRGQSAKITRTFERRPRLGYHQRAKLCCEKESPPVFLGAEVFEYIMYLKPLFSDITFDDLTSTANRLYNTNFTTKDIEDYYTYICEAMVSQRMARNAALHWPTPSNIMELEGPFLWVKESAFTGRENDVDYNKPIDVLAGHRRKYEATLAATRGCTRSDVAVANPDRGADVERLSKGRLTVEVLRDLSPSDLDRIFENREKWREPILQYWKKHKFEV
ncbi:MAG: hypothetical protein Q9226_002869 [Calogaya cf. arnoldii]